MHNLLIGRDRRAIAVHIAHQLVNVFDLHLIARRRARDVAARFDREHVRSAEADVD